MWQYTHIHLCSFGLVEHKSGQNEARVPKGNDDHLVNLEHFKPLWDNPCNYPHDFQYICLYKNLTVLENTGNFLSANYFLSLTQCWPLLNFDPWTLIIWPHMIYWNLTIYNPPTLDIMFIKYLCTFVACLADDIFIYLMMYKKLLLFCPILTSWAKTGKSWSWHAMNKDWLQ